MKASVGGEPGDVDERQAVGLPLEDQQGQGVTIVTAWSPLLPLVSRVASEEHCGIRVQPQPERHLESSCVLVLDVEYDRVVGPDGVPAFRQSVREGGLPGAGDSA